METLPTEILIDIFTYLDPKSAARSSRISRRFSNILKSDYVWRPVWNSYLQDSTIRYRKFCRLDMIKSTTIISKKSISSYKGYCEMVHRSCCSYCYKSITWRFGRPEISNIVSKVLHIRLCDLCIVGTVIIYSILALIAAFVTFTIYKAYRDILTLYRYLIQIFTIYVVAENNYTSSIYVPIKD